MKGNVADPEDIGRAVAAAEAMGPLRVAVSCAGVGVAMKVVGRENQPHDLATFQKIMTVNLVGTFNVLRLAAASMCKNELIGEERGVDANDLAVQVGVLDDLLRQLRIFGRVAQAAGVGHALAQ